jgi:uncharacterized protein YqjF (DUF2071 family)
MAEWLNNRLSVRLGPGTFGLPYRFGKLDYQHSHESGNLSGCVSDPKNGSSLAYEAQLNRDSEFKICEPDSLDEFLLERYSAYTSHNANRRFFRVWHSPWLQSPVEATVFDNTLLSRLWPWFASAKLVGANYSPGANEVWMGWPRRIVSQSLHASHHGLRSFFEMP